MIKNRILYLLLVVLTLFQCYILIAFNKINENKDLNFSDDYSISNLKNVKSIREVVNDFENYSNLKILSYNKISEGKWRLNCLLKGNKEEIIKDIEKLNYYKIVDYKLNYDNKDILLELELENKWL